MTTRTRLLFVSILASGCREDMPDPDARAIVQACKYARFKYRECLRTRGADVHIITEDFTEFRITLEQSIEEQRQLCKTEVAAVEEKCKKRELTGPGGPGRD